MSSEAEKLDKIRKYVIYCYRADHKILPETILDIIDADMPLSRARELF